MFRIDFKWTSLFEEWKEAFLLYSETELLTAQNYDPEVGVQFRQKDLQQFEIDAIFGRGVGKETGNHILRVQHGRRLAGTVFDETAPPVAGFTEHALTSAMEWLRKMYPIDEEAAYKARIEREEEEYERKVVADAERIGVWQPQQNLEGDKNYGKSVLDEMRAARKKEDEERRQNLERQETEIQQNTGTLQQPGRRGEIGMFVTNSPKKNWFCTDRILQLIQIVRNGGNASGNAPKSQTCKLHQK
ncbi:MAG: hypothetical protein M4579_002638 [Chaenotheca gracillima]|nr:MAG: hypothetical protein M4579_002638 [Chaenotheca gracillima]